MSEQVGGEEKQNSADWGGPKDRSIPWTQPIDRDILQDLIARASDIIVLVILSLLVVLIYFLNVFFGETDVVQLVETIIPAFTFVLGMRHRGRHQN